MEALFIGHSYIDVTFVTDTIPAGDDKALAKDYSFGIGGNAMVAAFACSKFGRHPDLLIPIADDWLGDMMLRKCALSGIRVYNRKVRKSSLSLVLPNNGQRAVLRCRDASYSTPFPKLDVRMYDALHIDGHQMDAALHYAKTFREAGKLTSLDGGGVRPKTEELLKYIDVAIVSERFAEQLKKTPEETVDYLIEKGVKVAGITQGEKGLIYAVDGKIETLKAIPVPKGAVVDSTGAGDIFHGAYMYSYLSDKDKSWRDHFKFARAASAISVQKLGAESSIPNVSEIHNLMEDYADLD